MIEFDTQIIPTARAMSFLFSGRVQLSKCAKNCTLPLAMVVLACTPISNVDQYLDSMTYFAMADPSHACGTAPAPMDTKQLHCYGSPNPRGQKVSSMRGLSLCRVAVPTSGLGHTVSHSRCVLASRRKSIRLRGQSAKATQRGNTSGASRPFLVTLAPEGKR